MSTRARAAPWFLPRLQLNDWGRVTTFVEARDRCVVHLDALDEAGFVHTHGPVLWVEPGWSPYAPPGDQPCCRQCGDVATVNVSSDVNLCWACERVEPDGGYDRFTYVMPDHAPLGQITRSLEEFERLVANDATVRAALIEAEVRLFRGGMVWLPAAVTTEVGQLVMARSDGSVAPIEGAASIAIGYATYVEHALVNGITTTRARVAIAEPGYLFDPTV